jgi:hypothetical protein
MMFSETYIKEGQTIQWTERTQTTVDKILHRKLIIQQHEPN